MMYRKCIITPQMMQVKYIIKIFGRTVCRGVGVVTGLPRQESLTGEDATEIICRNFPDSILIAGGMGACQLPSAGRWLMQLSRFTDYSLRVLLYLAVNGGQRATLHEIADFYPISLDHLRKVVHRLSKCGYLRTYRGKGGGMELGCDPADVNIGDLVRQFEGHEGLIDCAGVGCRLAQFCSLKEVFAKGQQALFDRLNDFTLADLIDSAEPEMIRLLDNPAIEQA